MLYVFEFVMFWKLVLLTMFVEFVMVLAVDYVLSVLITLNSLVGYANSFSEIVLLTCKIV